MRILITGGAGFIGSHIAEYYARSGNDVVVLDNLSRTEILGVGGETALFNWNYLKNNYEIGFIKGDIRNKEKIQKAFNDIEVVVHTASQVAVTTSIRDPVTDFEVNMVGTFNVLEAARKSKVNPVVVYCSTNKIYGSNVNKIPVKEGLKRYQFADEKLRKGIPEDFPIDLCEHSPYGCSKLAADLYLQDYAATYGLKTSAFRMSCIYGPRQFGVEDQGWVAWFALATMAGNPITIYGDGKQVRDVLYISDLVNAFDELFQRKDQLSGNIFNMGGGPENTLSLLELLDLLEELTGRRSKISFSDWRSSDQKVYVSNISKAKEELGWVPKVSPEEGIKKLVSWIIKNVSR